MIPTHLHFEWRNPRIGQFRAAASLHSHTLFSHETLDFLPRICRKIPFLDDQVRRLTAEYRRAHRRELDFSDAWWTPPLTPQAAWDLERKQIEGECGRRALSSPTDHDAIQGPLLFQ